LETVHGERRRRIKNGAAPLEILQGVVMNCLGVSASAVTRKGKKEDALEPAWIGERPVRSIRRRFTGPS
jgi:hypothetical protein